MRILFLAYNYDMGGIQRVNSVIGKKLGEYHKIEFYSLYKPSDFYNIKKSNNLIDGSYFLYNKSVTRKIIKSPVVLEKLIKNGNYTPDYYIRPLLSKLIKYINNNEIEIVIVNGPDLISCIPYLKTKTNAKYISWLHNNASKYFSTYSEGILEAFKKGLKSSDHLVTLTSEDLKEYERYNPKITKIYNPLTIENEKKSISTLTTKNISFTGRLSFEHKGIDMLLEIAKQIPDDWTITIAGNGSDQEKTKLKTMIKEKNIVDKVIFSGPLKDDKLMQHYLNSSIYIMTSRWEGFGLVLAEAMSFGLPIIAFQQIGSDEVLSQGVFGVLVEQGNIKDMNDEISDLIKNKEKLLYYQNKSLERVKDFSLESVVNDWNTMLEKVE